MAERQEKGGKPYRSRLSILASFEALKCEGYTYAVVWSGADQIGCPNVCPATVRHAICDEMLDQGRGERKSDLGV